MVVDENTNEEITQRGPEHRGELWTRGPNVMKGYAYLSPRIFHQNDTPNTHADTGATQKQLPKPSPPTAGSKQAT